MPPAHQTKKRVRFTDSGGLYLEVSPAGSKRWFCKLYANGKEGRMALGSYPGVGLADARKARDAAKLQKSKGANPVMARKVEKLKAITPDGDTFKATALEWYVMRLEGWSSHYAVAHRVFSTAGQVWRYAVATARAKRDVTPDIRGALKQHEGILPSSPTR